MTWPGFQNLGYSIDISVLPMCRDTPTSKEDLLRQVSQKEKEKYHRLSLICRILKNDTNELIYKTEIDSQT